MTNADKIRTLTDNELEDLIEKIINCVTMVENNIPDLNCRKCNLPFCDPRSGVVKEWLQAEYRQPERSGHESKADS